jgi:MATE family multidrug resistance protein
MNRIAGMMVIMGLLLYGRAMISMLFLGHLGELELAGGSLSIGFANITGYSVLSGLAMGMEPICGQAYGAKRWHLMGLALQRMLMVLLCACVPITFLWLNMQRILLWCGQEEGITSMAHLYILFSIPDLLAQVVLNPLRIYLRTQNIVVPLVWCAALALLFHVAINFLLVHALEMGVRGVALAASWTDFNLVGFLLTYLWWSGRYKNSWTGWSRDCLKDWRPLLNLAIPSCVSVCLEWWWYEFMIILSGLLIDADATVASMGILIQTTALLYIFPSALSLAVSTRVGNELGANRPNKARIAMLVALGCAGVVAVVAAILTTAMRHTWGGIFTSNKEILSLTAIAMPIVGLCELGNCPQTTGCGVLRGSARPSVGANINLGSFYFVGMPVAMILGFLFNVGFVGLWFGLLAAQYTCATLMLCVLFRTDWPLQAARAQLLMLSSSTRDGDQAASAVAMTNHELIIRCDQTNHHQLIFCDQTNYQLICCDQTNHHQLISCLPNELQLEQLVEVQHQQQEEEDQELVLILDTTVSEEMKAAEYRTKKLLQDQRFKITVDHDEETESLISIN